MDKCKQCSKELTGKRQYCNDACRMAYKRSQPEQPEQSQPEQIQPEHEQSEQISNPNIQPEQDAQLADIPCRLTEELLDQLPTGVSKPTAQPTNETEDMQARHLHRRASNYQGLSWKDSPEYAELIYRLLTLTPAQLKDEGQTMPQWKGAA